MIFYLTRS
jgi:DNA mismatch repair protein MSH2